jgi:drug/metabolite transporter (DMT)-like permease
MNAGPSRLAVADDPIRGIGFVCLAMMMFVSMNSIVKWLSAELPTEQIVWGRYFFHLTLIMVLFPRRVPHLLETGRLGMQILRSGVVLGATLCAFFSLRYMPLAEMSSIGFVAPLLVTALSVVFLKEQVRWRRWAAVAAGFCGMLIIVRPGHAAFQWVALLPFAMACCYATYQILTRIIAGVADPLNSLFYTALVGTLVMSCAVPFFWVWPKPETWALLIATGLFGGLGHFAFIKAFERAPASVLAPFSYTELIWSVTAGYVIFGDFPDVWTFVGAGIIVTAGLYIFHREQIRGHGRTTKPAPPA